MIARFGKKLVESGFSQVSRRKQNIPYPTKLDAKLDKLKMDISQKEDNLKTLLKKELITKNKYQSLLDSFKKPRQEKINKLQKQLTARAKEMERTGKVQTEKNNPRLAQIKKDLNKKQQRGMGKALRGGGKVMRG